jgi:hypothetical protein
VVDGQLKASAVSTPGKGPVYIQFKVGCAPEMDWNIIEQINFVSLRVMETASFLSSIPSSHCSDHAIPAPSVTDTVHSFQNFSRKLSTSHFCGLIVSTLPN